MEVTLMKANKFTVANLNDASKITQIKESIHSHDGINAVRFDMQAGTVTVDYDDGKYTESDIRNLVNSAGLNVIETK
jgi:copper chaperone CopZ